jgi:hypothetical protein
VDALASYEVASNTLSEEREICREGRVSVHDEAPGFRLGPLELSSARPYLRPFPDEADDEEEDDQGRHFPRPPPPPRPPPAASPFDSSLA